MLVRLIEIIILCCLLVFALGSWIYSTRIAQPVDSNQLQALLVTYSDQVWIPPARDKVSKCQIRGPLPDPNCTPGAIFSKVDRAIICVSGYTRTVRDVSVKLKSQIYTDYGLTYPQARNTYEADHLIPLELGGNNDIANLFPEVAEPRPGFHEKDLVENYLHEQVCSGEVALNAAQHIIAENWVKVYDLISSSERQRLLDKFSNF